MKSSSLSQRLLIHRENLCLTAGFLCPQLFPAGDRSSVLRQSGAEATFLGGIQVNVCLFGLYHTFIHVGWILKRACACVRCVCVGDRKECLDGLHAPVFSYVQRAREWNLMLSQMMTDSQKPCS